MPVKTLMGLGVEIYRTSDEADVARIEKEEQIKALFALDNINEANFFSP